MGLIDELLTPSARDESQYQRLVVAIAHAALGCAAVAWGVPEWLVLALYAAKELAIDLRKGGAWRDSLHDTAFIALGCAVAYDARGWAVVFVVALLSALFWSRK